MNNEHWRTVQSWQDLATCILEVDRMLGSNTMPVGKCGFIPLSRDIVRMSFTLDIMPIPAPEQVAAEAERLKPLAAKDDTEDF